MTTPWRSSYPLASRKPLTPTGGRLVLRRIGSNALAVSLADMKHHLRVDTGDDDVYIAGLIRAAQRYCEDHCRISITHQRWEYRVTAIPEDGLIELPVRPLVIESAGVLSGDVVLFVGGMRPHADWLMLSSSEYLILVPHRGGVPGEVAKDASPVVSFKTTDETTGKLTLERWDVGKNHYECWDANPPMLSFIDWPEADESALPITIEFVAGFSETDKDVPDGLKVAIKMLVANWYLTREANGGVGGPVAFGVDMLLREFDSGDYR